VIKPLLQDDAFLENVRAAPHGREQFHLWWLGQSGFLLQWDGRNLLFDPYLSDSLTRKYANTDRPHVRMTERVVAPDRLNFIDITTSSHNHTDHLDADTLRPLLARNPAMRLIVPAANQAFVEERLGMAAERLIPLDASDSVRCAGFEIHAVPAAHNELEQDQHSRFKYLGYVVAFGSFAVYHSGDTVRFPMMNSWLFEWSIDLALLPINGNRPERKVAGNLDGREAAELAKEMGAGLVVPCHYEMFEFNTASPRLFEETCREIEQPYRILKAGERLTISSNSTP
jgi:L-ascorbate metabolism protein UlaG (beta-lactamase superfamily)